MRKFIHHKESNVYDLWVDSAFGVLWKLFNHKPWQKAAAFNLGLVLRVRFGSGASKAMANTLKEAMNGLYLVEKCLLRRLSFLLGAFPMWQKQNHELGTVPLGQNVQAAA